MAAAAAPIDREATGWFESAAAPAGGPTVQRRVDRRTKRMEAYPPIDRKARPVRPGPGRGAAHPSTPRTPTRPPARTPAPVAGDVSSNGRPARRPNAGGGPPTDQDAGP